MPSSLASVPRRRTTAALAALSTLLVLGNGLAAASPAPASAPATTVAAAQKPQVRKPNVRVTKATATSTPTATGTDVRSTLTLTNVTSTRKSTRNTRLSLTNAAGTFRLGKAVVQPIAPKGTAVVRVSHTVSSKVPAGTYALRACRGPVAAETCRTSAATVTVAPAALVAAPAALTFGDVLLGSAPARGDVTITNSGKTATGVLAVAASGSRAFTVTASTCAASLVPGASCTVSLAFDPSVPGAAAGSLDVTGATAGATSVALSGTGVGAPVLAVSRSAFEFGDTLVGASSAPVELTVTNTGNTASGVPTVALAPASTDDFEVSATTCTTALAPAATCVVDVTFSPSAAGGATAALNVSAAPGGAVTTALSGTGLAPAELSLAPGSLAFGNEVVGDATPSQTLTLTNDGDVASGVPTVALAGDDAGQFTIVDNGCTTAVAAGGSCEVDVAFAPDASGTASASLTATAAPGGTTSAALAGTGQTPSELSISESSYDFGFSDGPIEHTFTITNDGDATTGAPGVDLGGSSAFSVTTDTCTTALAGAASCTVGVTYTGSGSDEQSGQLSVSAAPGGTVTADLTGSPLALTVAPTSHDFGGVLVGGSSATRSFTLTNHRLTAVQVDGEGVTGPFPLDSSCFEAVLPAGGTCTFSAHFAPTGPGTANGSLDYFAQGASAHVAVTGEGLAPAALSVDRSNIQFGGYAPSTTGNQVVTVTNTGDAASAAPSVTIAGADASEFNVQGTTCSGPLAGGASCTFTLQFAPATLADQKTATATVDGPGAPTVALAGISAPVGVTMVPLAHDFGTRTVGSSTVHVFRVVNTTESGQTINSVSSQTPFSLDIPGDFTCVLSINSIQPHNWCTISIAFRPSSTGSFSRSLTAGGDFGSATATMNGTAVAAFGRTTDSFGVPSRPMTTSVRLRNGTVETVRG